MGALHAGHAALIERARRHAGKRGTVVVSIFVNPAQFGPKEDFARYPRSFEADRQLCERHGADAIFHPSAEAMYGTDFSTWVTEEHVSRGLCGATRPGHFRGVSTVVLKLFTITSADAAIFGQKDLQQGMVVRRMVRDLNLPVRLLLAPTVREKDGLALSSRNRYLTPEERAQAPVLQRALGAALTAFRRGMRSAAELRQIIVQSVAAAELAKLDYAEVVDAESLQRIERVESRAFLAIAVFFGTTRLIDNLALR